MSPIVSMLLGGVALFLFSIHQLSKILQDIFSETAKYFIQKSINNIYAAILIGVLSTIIAGSSSAIIIILIVFINAEILDFHKGIGIIMGANIGTSISSQIIAFNIAQYSVIALIIGLMVHIFSKKKHVKDYAQIVFFFGLLFFGLFIMEESVMPLKNSAVFNEWIIKVENNQWHGALIGGLITLLIQSSSATVGFAIVLGKQNLITIAGGIAIMLGAELGTCSDTLIATINGSKQALKAGLFHLIFNLTTILLGLIFFNYFVALIDFISEDSGIDNKIATSHFLFNFFGVLLFIPLSSVLEKLLNYFFPDEVQIDKPSS